MTFVQKPFFPETLHDMPDGFHVVGFHRLVVIVKINPPAEPGNGFAPLLYIAEHAGPARLVEVGNAEFFNVGL